MSFHAKILILFLLIFLCSWKLALHSQSLILQVYTTGWCLPNAHSFATSERLCVFTMDTYHNFKQSSALITGFQVMLLCVFWGEHCWHYCWALKAVSLDSQAPFVFSFSSSGMCLVSFLFCSPWPSLQR